MKICVKGFLTDLDNLILLGILMTLFFLPLHEKLKAAGFWITLFFWLVKLARKRDELKIWIPPLAWALLWFVAVALLSAAVSDYQNRATRGALDAFRSTLIFLILANQIRSFKEVTYITLALVGGFALAESTAIRHFFSSGAGFELFSVGEQNSAAQVLSFFLVFLLGLFFCLQRRVFLKIILFLSAGVTGFAIVLTYARGIWVAVMAVLLAFLVVRRDWKVPVFLSVMVAAVLMGMSFSERFKFEIGTLRNPLTASTMTSRYDIWRESLEIVKDKPLLGIGLKTYGLPQAAQKYNLSHPSHAHNMFVNVAAELGFSGLAVLILWLAIYFRDIIRMRSQMRLDYSAGLWFGGLGCFVLLLVGGVAHSMLYSESSLTLMTVLGLMFAGYRIDNGECAIISRNLYRLPGRGDGCP